MSRRTTTVVAAGLALALLLGGVVSYFASGAPDGLDTVAAEEGFAGTEEEHDLAGSPFAGYETRGVDQGFLTGGLAGVAGVGVCFLVVGGLAYTVRRRGTDRESRTGARPPGERARR